MSSTYELRVHVTTLADRISSVVAHRACVGTPPPDVESRWEELGSFETWMNSYVGEAHAQEWIWAPESMSSDSANALLEDAAKYVLDKCRAIGSWVDEHAELSAASSVELEVPEPDTVWDAYEWYRGSHRGVALNEALASRCDSDILKSVVMMLVRYGGSSLILDMLEQGAKIPRLAAIIPWAIKLFAPHHIAKALAQPSTAAIGLDLLAGLEVDRCWDSRGGTVAPFADELRERLWRDALDLLGCATCLGSALDLRAVSQVIDFVSGRAEYRKDGWSTRVAELTLSAIAAWTRGGRRFLPDVFESLWATFAPPLRPRGGGLPRNWLRRALWAIDHAPPSSSSRVRIADAIREQICDAMGRELSPDGAKATFWMPSDESVPSEGWGTLALVLEEQGRLEDLLKSNELAELTLRKVFTQEQSPEEHHFYPPGELYSLRHDAVHKLRLLLRVLCATARALARLPEGRRSVARTRDKVESRLVEIVDQHTRHVAVEGRCDAFAPEFEDSNVVPHAPRALAVELGTLIGVLRPTNGEKIVHTLEVNGADPVVLVRMAAAATQSSHRKALLERAARLRPERLLVRLHTTHEIQRAIRSWMSEGHFDQAERLLELAAPYVHRGAVTQWPWFEAYCRVVFLAHQNRLEELRKLELPPDVHSTFRPRGESYSLAQLRDYFLVAAASNLDPQGSLRKLLKMDDVAAGRLDYWSNLLRVAADAVVSASSDDDVIENACHALELYDQRYAFGADVAVVASELRCAWAVKDWARIGRVLDALSTEVRLCPEVLRVAVPALRGSAPDRAETLVLEATQRHGADWVQRHELDTLSEPTWGRVEWHDDDAYHRPRILVVGATPLVDSSLQIALERHGISSDRDCRTIRDAVGSSAETIPALDISAEELTDEIERLRPTILHVASHGANGTLAWEDEEGVQDDLGADALCEMLRDRLPVLVVFAACETAGCKAEGRDIDDLARTVFEQLGVACIGFVGESGSDQTKFIRRFYGNLASGMPLRLAFDDATGHSEDEPELYVDDVTADLIVLGERL